MNNTESGNEEKTNVEKTLQNGTENNAESGGCLKIVFTVLIVAFVLFAGASLYFFYEIIVMTDINPRRNVAAMQEYIPQARAIFEQSRAQFDILVNGEFIEMDMVITSSTVMDRIEELPEEEMEAIIFLFTGDELEDNFFAIQSFRGSVGADLYRRGTAALEIWYGGFFQMVEISNHRYSERLGGGYELWIWARQPHGMGVGIMGTFAAIPGVIALVLLIPIIVIWPKAIKKSAHT